MVGFWWCLLASSRHGVRLLNLISQVFAGSGHMKEGPFSAMVEAEVRLNYYFAQIRPFSRYASFQLPVRGLCELFFSIHYRLILFEKA